MSDMTKERAIEVLKAWNLNWSDEFTANEFEQAFDMAISALSTEGKYIKKSELLQHVTTEELSDFKDCDVIHAEEIDKLTTYSFPNSAKPEFEKVMDEIHANKGKEVVIVSDSAENKGDLISRQAVLDELEKWDWQELYLPIHFKQILDDVPSVDNKCEWIPVSERLPKDGQSVLFCDIDEDIMVGYHVKGRPVTHFSQDGTYEDMKNVRAWQPLPEPYKAEKGGE